MGDLAFRLDGHQEAEAGKRLLGGCLCLLLLSTTMGGRAAKAQSSPLDVAKAQKAFAAWLERQPLSTRTADAYRAQVGAYLRWLEPAGIVRRFDPGSASGRCTPSNTAVTITV
ncbi:MAG TPA: hypothetical protein VGR26_08055 [Acidimicrobiales bacterium]|nr:hypothetical protein [Acidimicrobiales bacterium]